MKIRETIDRAYREERYANRLRDLAYKARDEGMNSRAFKALVKELAMQVAAANPRCVRREELDADVIAQEREIYAAQSADKPPAVIHKIVEGKLDKFYRDVCLMEQGYIRDPARTIADIITDYITKVGEKVEVRRFVRFQLGEGLDGKGQE